MPIQGKFYSSNELQVPEVLGVTKARINQVAIENDWITLVPGSALYCAEQVEDYLLGRGIDPSNLPILDYDYPDGATLTERESDADDLYNSNP